MLEAWGLGERRLDAPARSAGFREERRDGDLVLLAGLRGAFVDAVPRMELPPLGPARDVARTDFADDAVQPSYEIDYGRPSPAILVIGDSFTRDVFDPFWARVAGWAHWTHDGNGACDRAVVARVRPDYVLFQFLQRSIPEW